MILKLKTHAGTETARGDCFRPTFPPSKAPLESPMVHDRNREDGKQAREKDSHARRRPEPRGFAISLSVRL